MITFRKRKTYNKIGTPLSIVPQINYVDITDDDLLMLSQPDSAIDQLNSGYYKSKAIKIAEFEKKLSADIFSVLGLGDIAYDDPALYAKSVHAHPQYQHIEIASFCSNRKDATLCSLVTFESDGASENISIPSVPSLTLDGTKHLQLGPKIGEMRMFAADYASIVKANGIVDDMQSDQFSGWICPNGQSLDKDRFPAAYDMFGDTLPVIDKYLLKLNPYQYNTSDGQDSAQIVETIQPDAEQHQHETENGILEYEDSEAAKKGVQFKYTVQYRAAVDKTYDWSDAVVDNCNDALEYGYIVCGCTAKTMVQAEVQLVTTIDAANSNIEIAQSDYRLALKPTTPSFTNVIAMLYIGRPYRESSGISEQDGLLPDQSYQEYNT